MTVKYDNFIKEFSDLCKKHDVYITTSGYDLVQVWDLRDDHIKDLDMDMIEDLTQGSEEYERHRARWVI